MATLQEEISRRRTFAIISHPDAGKTTLTEKFLLYGGAIAQAGEVKGKRERAAKSDWMEIEKQRGISVTSSVMQFQHGGYCINILDTPGHQDFSEDTYRTLMAADSAVMVIDGAKGVEPQTRKLFKVCALRNIPIFTFINKMDRETRDPLELCEEVERELGIDTYPVNWPIGCGKEFAGVYDRDKRCILHFTDAGHAKKAGITEIELDDPALVDLIGQTRRDTLADEVELLGAGRESFDRFRLDYYPAEYDPDLGTSPREIMKKVYERAVRYAQSFAPGARSLLFSGATGLGKTFLSACIARTVADRGYSVCYVSAEALFADFEQQKFRPREGEDVTRKYLACDLLILDDLGTEMTTQFTIAALYQVVNTRLMESRATIVSTNLPVGELDRRYSAQIASRLLGAYTLYKFSGKDIRMLQKSMARPTEDMNR